MIRADTVSDVFLSEVYQLHDEVSDLGEVVSTEHLTTIVLDTLPAKEIFNNKSSSDQRSRLKSRGH